jgi:hypothetical protein
MHITHYYIASPLNSVGFWLGWRAAELVILELYHWLRSKSLASAAHLDRAVASLEPSFFLPPALYLFTATAPHHRPLSRAIPALRFTYTPLYHTYSAARQIHGHLGPIQH